MLGLSNEKIALAYTNLIYRNTDLEDYHSELVEMDMAFYDIIHGVVSERIEYIMENCAQIAKIKSAKTVNKLIMEGDSNAVGAFVLELGINAAMGSDWDAPTMSDDTTINRKDLAGYILKGHFLEYCEKHMHLDDQAICYINKDVYNRVYTLVMLGLL